jgi:hypothetical protein
MEMAETIWFASLIIGGVATTLLSAQKSRSFGQALRPFEFSHSNDPEEAEGNNSREQRALILLICAYVIPSVINFLIWFSVDKNLIENYNDVAIINIIAGGISIATLAWACLSVKSTKWRIVTILLAILQISIFVYHRYQ